MDGEIPQYPLYGSTFHLYHASPLYNKNASILHRASLTMHARRMRELLKGDVLRGVQVSQGFEATGNSTIASLGPLEECTWELLGDTAAWEKAHRGAEDAVDDTADDLSYVVDTREVSPEAARGIMIRLQYAKTTYTALLLRDPEQTKAPQHFTYLPLVLLRMPAPLRNMVVQHLASTFDCRIDVMRLRPGFLVASLEDFLSQLDAPGSAQSIPDTVKLLQVQLAFPAKANMAEAGTGSLLKHIDINISRDDIYGFFARGKILLARSRDKFAFLEKESPFTAALIHYLAQHLAFEPEAVLACISKITTGLFTLSAEGKIKIAGHSSPNHRDSATAPQASAVEMFLEEFYASLVKQATIGTLETPG